MRVIVPVFDFRDRCLRFFDSRDELGGDVTFVDVALGTLARPPAPAPVSVADPRAGRMAVSDGTLFGGDPTLVALSVLEPQRGVLVTLSDGGEREPLDARALRRAPAVALDAAHTSLTDVAHVVAHRTLGTRGYVRLAPPPARGREPGFERLHDEARRLVSDRSADLHALATRLSSTSIA